MPLASRAVLLAVAAACTLVAPVANAAGPGDDHAVLHDPAAAFFPTADEVQEAIAATQGHAWFTAHHLGASESGRPLTVLEVTDPGSPVSRHERVVTLLETQQHGNEPAGTGAAVPLIHDLLAGHGTGVLRNQILLLLPMANPDGATANARGNRDGVDINRDHVGLETSEARALHEVLKRWDVHVAIDHHEYGGIGLGEPVPVRVYDFDLTLMHPNHGNVRAPTAQLALELDREVLRPAAEEGGYSAGSYGITTVNGIPVQQTAGGPDPGILRNSFGLNNVAGLLAETFIAATPETPFQNAERRIAVHRLVMDTTLDWASANADRIIAAKRESERLNREEPMAEYSEVGGEAGDDGSRRGPLAAAYRTSADLAALFEGHGLPAGTAVPGGTVHDVHGQERAGLVAAILHPLSSRRVAEAEPAAALGPSGAAEAAGAREASGAAPLAALAALAVAAATFARRGGRGGARRPGPAPPG